MTKRFTLTVCAIVKNESAYIEEWIEFHILQGVEHFFIYDNTSTDDTLKVLEKYTKQDLVTVIHWPINPPQMPAYTDALLRFIDLTEWMAFIDCDEFLFASDNRLPDFLNTLSNDISVLAVHWLLYGSSGHSHYSKGLVVEKFTKRAIAANNHVKSIVRVKSVVSVGKNPHTFRVIGRRINERMVDLPEEYALLPTPSADKIRINHYHTKSKEEYLERKLSKPDSGSGKTYSTSEVEHMFEVHDKNEIEDCAALAKTLEIDLSYLIKRVRMCG